MEIRNIGVEFSLENRLMCLKTKFQKKGQEKLWTYMKPNNSKAQVDYTWKA